MSEGMTYTFTAKPYQHSVTQGMAGWAIVSLPNVLPYEIRDTLNNWKKSGGTCMWLPKLAIVNGRQLFNLTQSRKPTCFYESEIQTGREHHLTP